MQDRRGGAAAMREWKESDLEDRAGVCVLKEDSYFVHD